MSDEQTDDLAALENQCGEVLIKIADARRAHNQQMEALYDEVRGIQMAILKMRIQRQSEGLRDGRG